MQRLAADVPIRHNAGNPAAKMYSGGGLRMHWLEQFAQ